MMSLTDRQIAILKAIVEEYIETAMPVGSEPLERKYNLGVSPATIRNEMALLVQQGFLKQPHTSAGRIPTAASLRLYIRELMQEAQLSVAEEVMTRERIWDHRHDLNKLMQEATKSLSQQLKTISVACAQNNTMYSSGVAHILTMPEFFDIDVTRQVLTLLDEENTILQWFTRPQQLDEPVHIIFGEELNHPFLEPVGFVFADFVVGSQTRGAIGVIGPARLDFAHVVPRVKFYSQLITELTRGW